VLDPDLLELHTNVSNVSPIGYSYVIQSNSPNIEIWSDANKSQLILGGSGQAAYSPSSLDQALWVEWKDPQQQGSATVTLMVRNNTTGNLTNLDSMNFHTFTSDVILFSGERFDIFPPGPGILAIDKDLYSTGYDAHFYVPDHSDAAYTEAASAVMFRGVTQLALIGHSHGAGAVYKLAAGLESDPDVLATNRLNISFAAYVDAIEFDSIHDYLPESRAPIGAAYLMNFYETKNVGFPDYIDRIHGVEISQQGGISVDNFDMDRYNVNHFTIATNQLVRSAIEKGIRRLVHI
jgi:hypothetical protein